MVYDKKNNNPIKKGELSGPMKVRFYSKLESLYTDLDRMLSDLYKINKFIRQYSNTLYELERTEMIIKPLKETKAIFKKHILESDYVKLMLATQEDKDENKGK